MHREFIDGKLDWPEFTYGSSAPKESLAEAARMYMFGLEGRVGRRGQKIGAMSAAEWRFTFPHIAEAVEDIVWDYSP